MPRKPIPTTEVGGYNNRTHKIMVDPSALWDLGVRSETIGMDMVDIFSSLMTNIWADLKVGWAGASAAEAELFHTAFDHVRIMFYGLAKDEKLPAGVPENNGVLPQLLNILKTAASLYGQAEESAYQLFRQFHMVLGSSLYSHHLTMGEDHRWLRNPDGQIVYGDILQDDDGNYVKDANGYYVMEYVPDTTPPDYPEYRYYCEEDRWWIDALYAKKFSAEDPIAIQREQTNPWDAPGVPRDETVGETA